jgi:hypothetical protein
MSKLVNEQWHFVEFVHKSPLYQLRRILSHIIPLQVKVICEIALNIKLGNLLVNGKQISPGFINFLSKRTNSITKKKLKIINNKKVLKQMIDSVYPSLHTIRQ